MNIIFDLDGTLIDSKEGILWTVAGVLNKHQVKPKVGLDYQIIGPPLKDMLEIVSGRSQDALAPLIEDFKTLYDSEGVLKTNSYADISEMLSKLTAHHKLFIATNKRIEPTTKIIDFFGWDFFEDVIGINSNPDAKSKDDLLKLLLDRYALPLSQTLYIGDTAADALSAKNVGLQFFHAGWGDIKSLDDAISLEHPFDLLNKLSN